MLRRLDDALGFVGVHVRVLEQAGQELALEDARDRRVDGGHRDGAALHGVDERSVGLGIGRLEIVAGFERLDRGLRPIGGDLVAAGELRDGVVVRDDDAAEAPLALQHVVQQPVVHVRRHAVDLVVAGHDREGAGLLDRALERPQELGPELALADQRRRGVDAGLVRAVAGEVLQRREDLARAERQAAALVAADGGDAELADQERILAVGLFDAAPARIARQVDDRRQHDLAAAGPRFLGGDGHRALDQRRVPGRAEARAAPGSASPAGRRSRAAPPRGTSRGCRAACSRAPTSGWRW